MNKFIKNLPKAELHIHIDGAIRPELVFIFAQRNKINLPFKSISELEKAYKFDTLSQFLDLYYIINQVIVTEFDFYELTLDYLARAADQGVKYAEIFFETQSFHERNICFDVIFNGIYSAIYDSINKFGIQAYPILCFLRHYPEESAFKALKDSWSYRDKIIAVGLAGYEKDNPPSNFIGVMKEARSYGYNITVHAGEEEGPTYVWQALELLKAQRIDHGIKSLQDPVLIDYLIQNNIPLTLCPISNLALKVIDSLTNYPLKKMLNLGIRISINSDDPAYFGSYIADNYSIIANQLNLTKEEIVSLARNSFLSSFTDQATKDSYLIQIDEYLKQNI